MSYRNSLAGCFVFPVLMRISCLSGGGEGGERRGAKGKAEQNSHSEANKVVSGPQDDHSPFNCSCCCFSLFIWWVFLFVCLLLLGGGCECVRVCVCVCARARVRSCACERG